MLNGAAERFQQITVPMRIINGFKKCGGGMFRSRTNYVVALVILVLSVAFPFVVEEGGFGGMLCCLVLALGFGAYAYILGRHK